MLKKFIIKDIVFLAIISAFLLLVSSLVMPIVMFTKITALRQLFAAPLFALFSVIAIIKVKKIGSLSLLGLFTGMVLIFMSPVMFVNNFFGAIISEFICLLVFKINYFLKGEKIAEGNTLISDKMYEDNKYVIFVSTIYIPITLPISVVATIIYKGNSLSYLINSYFQTFLIFILTIFLAYLGAIMGLKLSKELKKAGKI